MKATKLSLAQKQEVCEKYASGISQKKLAELYSVGVWTIKHTIHPDTNYKNCPMIIDKFKLSESQDRRVKLTDAQKKEIYHKYNVVGNCSQRSLAKEYKVSRRLITFIIDPSKHEQNKIRREERGGSKIYYDKESHGKAISRTRAYKKELLEKGELK